MRRKVKVMKCETKSQKDMSVTLSQMEKIVEDKIANQKVFTPILYTVVTSIIAFLFVHNIGNNAQTVQFSLAVFIYALFCFGVLIFALFGKSDYSAPVKKINRNFQPHQLGSYCYLSDEDFLNKMKKYAGRELTYEEALSVKCIKQKINEYVFKKSCLNFVLTIILIGLVILCIICIFGIVNVPKMPQYSGETV